VTGQCRGCNSHAINPGHHGRPTWEENVDNDLCDTCFWRTRAEYLKRLLAEVIMCLPVYSGCGDISREQRVRAECVTILGDDMPLTLNEKTQGGIPPGLTSKSEWDRANRGKGPLCADSPSDSPDTPVKTPPTMRERLEHLVVRMTEQPEYADEAVVWAANEIDRLTAEVEQLKKEKRHSE